MALNIARSFSVLFSALALVIAVGHLLEMSGMTLSWGEYLAVQQIYRDWTLVGIVGALLSTLLLTILGPRKPRVCVPTLIALLCLAGTQVIFWTFTFPVIRQTSNWTTLPANWLQLRIQWENSHAASAILILLALILLIVSVLTADE